MPWDAGYEAPYCAYCTWRTSVSRSFKATITTEVSLMTDRFTVKWTPRIINFHYNSDSDWSTHHMYRIPWDYEDQPIEPHPVSFSPQLQSLFCSATRNSSRPDLTCLLMTVIKFQWGIDILTSVSALYPSIAIVSPETWDASTNRTYTTQFCAALTTTL